MSKLHFDRMTHCSNTVVVGNNYSHYCLHCSETVDAFDVVVVVGDAYAVIFDDDAVVDVVVDVGDEQLPCRLEKVHSLGSMSLLSLNNHTKMKMMNQLREFRCSLTQDSSKSRGHRQRMAKKSNRKRQMKVTTQMRVLPSESVHYWRRHCCFRCLEGVCCLKA